MIGVHIPFIEHVHVRKSLSGWKRIAVPGHSRLGKNNITDFVFSQKVRHESMITKKDEVFRFHSAHG